MRTLKEIERLVFGPRARSYVLHSIPVGSTRIRDRLIEIADGPVPPVTEIEDLLPRLREHYPVVLVEYGVVLPRDIPPDEVPTFLDAHVGPHTRLARHTVGFLSKDARYDLYDEFYRCLKRADDFVETGTDGDQHYQRLRKGEALHSAAFGLSPVPRLEPFPDSASI